MMWSSYGPDGAAQPLPSDVGLQIMHKRGIAFLVYALYCDRFPNVNAVRSLSKRKLVEMASAYRRKVNGEPPWESEEPDILKVIHIPRSAQRPDVSGCLVFDIVITTRVKYYPHEDRKRFGRIEYSYFERPHSKDLKQWFYRDLWLLAERIGVKRPFNYSKEDLIAILLPYFIFD